MNPENASNLPAIVWDAGIVIAATIMALAVIAGYLIYLFILQKKFFEACREEKQMGLYFQSPAGLPNGTIRSILALVIVTISILLIVPMAFAENLQFPESLAAVLGTVLGFYFGSRTGTKEQEKVLGDQMKTIQGERDRVVHDKEQSEALTLITRIGKGIALSRAVIDLLPEKQRASGRRIIDKLENGMDTAKTLLGTGSMEAARNKAAEVFDLFREANPAREIVAKAIPAFSRVLGGVLPPVAIITAVAGIGVKLSGVAYQKWKARILHLPFQPSLLPLEVVDANTGLVVFLNSPRFKEAFLPELQTNDRDFVQSAVHEFLRTEETESLWKRYRKRFDSREDFEAGLDEFRRSAAALELGQEIDPEWTADVGGIEKLTAAIDRLHADDAARASLDELVMVVEGLHRKGEPVQSIFSKVLKEVTP